MNPRRTKLLSRQSEIAQKVARLALRALATHVVFNNNMEDQGQRNAAALMRVLQR